MCEHMGSCVHVYPSVYSDFSGDWIAAIEGQVMTTSEYWRGLPEIEGCLEQAWEEGLMHKGWRAKWVLWISWMAPFVQQLWYFQCPGLPTAFYSSQLQVPLHGPTACSSTRPGARASWVWAAGWRGEGQGQPTKVKSTRVFHDLDSASVLDFNKKNRKSKHRSRPCPGVKSIS